MSKSSNAAKIDCLMSWLIDIKKFKPKKQYATVKQDDTDDETLLVKNEFVSYRKRKK